MPISKKRPKTRIATHRPAKQKRNYRHDSPIAVDMFSGFGGWTDAIRRAGFDTILAANHNEYKTKVHEANHPYAEHWIADLVDRESSDYNSARDLPAADLLVAGVSCRNHSQANTEKAYAQRMSLFDLDDPEFDARVTRSERDRATANCVLAYADEHHPPMILVECTTELTSWGPALTDRPKVGDGTTFRWWLKQFGNLGYEHKVMYLNSMFFGVGQSRNRLFIAFWDKRMPTPDLDHCPLSWCGRCDEMVEAVWSWKTGVPPTGSVNYGVQYNYRCGRCRCEVIPPMTPSLNALDLTNRGIRIGDKPIKKHKDGSTGPLAAGTMARAERCRQRFAEFPAVLMPAKSVHGTEKHLWQPMPTQTSQQETALLSTSSLTDLAAADADGLFPQSLTGHVFAAHRHNGDGQHFSRPMDTVTSTHEKAVLLAAVNNYQGAPRGLNEPLPTQAGSETLSLISAGVLPYRKNTIPAVHSEAMPTVTAEQIPGLLIATATVEPVDQAVSGWLAEALAGLASTPLEDCYFRMLGPNEIGRGCGFDVDFPGHQGTFIVWGSARDQTDGFGNAVSPAVGEWIAGRMRQAFHGRELMAA